MGTGASGLVGRGGGSSKMTYAKAANLLNRTGFTDLGGGNWQLDIPGVGGASILDETGSTRAVRAGFMPGQKAYSMQFWDASGVVRDAVYYDRLNDAKYHAKNAIRATL